MNSTTDYVIETPLEEMKYCKHTSYCGKIYVKNETQQTSGAFKFRGNVNKLSKYPTGTKVVTASTGNHAKGLTLAASVLGLKAIIFLPKLTPLKKIEGIIENIHVEIIFIDGDYTRCEIEAKKYALNNNLIFISSFDDIDIIEGHKTLCREIDCSNIQFDTVYVPIGGGGLISACLEHWKSEKNIIGVELDSAPAMKLSLDSGERIRINECSGFAEGLLVREVGRIPFEICNKYKPEIMTVSEHSIKRAIKILWEENGMKSEGAGAASFAAAMEESKKRAGNCICIISGGNINDDLFSAIINDF
ncbi:threonine/serine dehydratase [Bacillus cereus group sp. BfR-BA-01349]|uniref:threonine ammonia-lyase n=1 Tax=Bacillus cereus group sp. BfR-BA-01349 TaxID=2920312 RepID=UPI001F5685D8